MARHYDNYESLQNQIDALIAKQNALKTTNFDTLCTLLKKDKLLDKLMDLSKPELKSVAKQIEQNIDDFISKAKAESKAKKAPAVAPVVESISAGNERPVSVPAMPARPATDSDVISHHTAPISGVNNSENAVRRPTANTTSGVMPKTAEEIAATRIARTESAANTTANTVAYNPAVKADITGVNAAKNASASKPVYSNFGI